MRRKSSCCKYSDAKASSFIENIGMKHKTKYKFDTQLIHEGEEQAQAGRSVIAPIYRSSTYEMDGESIYHEILYGRLNNSPAHKALHQKLARLEAAEDALTFASGMAAITMALLSVLRPGDHIIAQKCVYGGTYGFLLDEAEALGIEVSWADMESPDSWESLIKDNTKMFYLESMSNPLLQVPDFDTVVQFAKKHSLKTMIDNTFASPYCFRPIEHGIDIVVHSATKYINGHTDVIAGCVMGTKASIDQMKKKLSHFGGCLDPQACYLLNRGLKTLSVRMDRQNANALKLAQFLDAHKLVGRVNYPGLPENQFHANASKYFSNGFGGMLSFELESKEVAKKLIAALQIPAEAPSLGGVESLVILPCESSHVGQSKSDLEAMGLKDSLVRVSVGIESIGDLIDDFTQALDRQTS
ncbi:cystathionine beta-lyase [Candidatus Kaiserbacteria bacterium]|nr:MAG: cystathionine beta-lyase [Candidatus Kaiserbacteria bacterium]